MTCSSERLLAFRAMTLPQDFLLPIYNSYSTPGLESLVLLALLAFSPRRLPLLSHAVLYFHSLSVI